MSTEPPAVRRSRASCSANRVAMGAPTALLRSARTSRPARIRPSPRETKNAPLRMSRPASTAMSPPPTVTTSLRPPSVTVYQLVGEETERSRTSRPASITMLPPVLSTPCPKMPKPIEERVGRTQPLVPVKRQLACIHGHQYWLRLVPFLPVRDPSSVTCWMPTMSRRARIRRSPAASGLTSPVSITTGRPPLPSSTVDTGSSVAPATGRPAV